ncbi:sulfatase [Pseudidiomarina atlantica]|uniref:Sulfatase n=1 Tax=Pseudidiomarina atlantica TaxID=1517416 RepID=A0A094ISK1_9GAMM|nr:LTA synthase family protein [Pseudidiomarina atlantica]KFZ28794.1 sulfatase [Pseudidiomarina atlantica]
MRIHQQFRRALQPFRVVLTGYVLGLFILSLSRLALMLWQYDRVAASGDLVELLVLGIRADCIQMGYVTLPLLLILPVFWLRPLRRLGGKLQQIWWVCALTYVTFMEIATPAFILQYDLRPNRLFVEYLTYPQEVLSMLWGGFAEWLLIGAAALLVTVVLLLKLSRRLATSQQHEMSRAPRRAAIFVWPVLLLLMVFGVRSTLDHRPANPAFFAVTGDALVNDLVISSAYSVEYALYSMRHEANAALIYGSASLADIIQKVRQDNYLADKEFPFEAYPTVHYNRASRSYARPKNIVVILEESLGATFVEKLGGINATPELEALSEHGWWFEQLYATGTRSVRGIEAVVTGFLPTPARSVVKLPLSQQGFFTYADLLARQGYFTEFMYGGETHFDNMQRFFVGNGFQSVRGVADIEKPAFIGSWGASDEDLLQSAHARFEQLNGQTQPFFSLVFTSSNHEPFEFPDGRIELYAEPKQRVENAVKYADFALGEFFRKARQSSYWDDTIFLVVADHDTRVYGNELVPVSKFHIPGLILGGSIEPRTINTVTSQIDLLPTVVSLAGVSAWTASLGQDLSDVTQPPANRAMMQFGANFAWLQGHDLAIVTPAEDFTGQLDKQQHRFQADVTAREPLLEVATAHALLPSLLYQQQAYFVPQE